MPCVIGFAHDDRILYKSVKRNGICQRIMSVSFPGISFTGTGIITLNESEERVEASVLRRIILYRVYQKKTNPLKTKTERN